VSDTVVPAWHEARRELPFVFASGAAAAAGAAATVLTPPELAGPARRLAVLGGATELGATKLMEARLGPFLAEPYHRGTGGGFARAAKAATASGTALMALGGRRRPVAALAGGLLLAGAALERFAVFHAGKDSAADPRYTSISQRQRSTRSSWTGESRFADRAAGLPLNT
jgi:hypothetical protein